MHGGDNLTRYNKTISLRKLNSKTRRLSRAIAASTFQTSGKVISHKGHIAAAHGRLSRIHRVAPKSILRAYLGPPESITQTASRSVQPFLHSSHQKVTILYIGSLPPQNCPFARGIWTPSNTWFLEPTQVHKLNGISIGSSVCAGLTIVTDRPTDRPRYSVL